MKDDSTRRVYRRYDFSKTQQITPLHGYYCISGRVNNADTLYLVIESLKPETKHRRSWGALTEVLPTGVR